MHGKILEEVIFSFFFCAGLERVDGITVLGKLDLTWRSIGGKQLSFVFTCLEVQLVTANACGCISHGDSSSTTSPQLCN